MQANYREYFDHLYLMKPWGENSILFTAEFAALGGELTQEQARAAIEAYFLRSENKFWFDDKEGWSHDNHTGAMCLSKLMNLPYHTKLYPKNFHSYLHPRDAAFHLWLTYPILGLPFLWISSVIMLFAAFFPTYKNIDGDEILATDGDLLSFLRTRSTNLPITKFLLDKIIKKRGGWELIFRTYFKDQFHPNNELISNQ